MVAAGVAIPERKVACLLRAREVDPREVLPLSCSLEHASRKSSDPHIRILKGDWILSEAAPQERTYSSSSAEAARRGATGKTKPAVGPLLAGNDV